MQWIWFLSEVYNSTALWKNSHIFKNEHKAGYSSLIFVSYFNAIFILNITFLNNIVEDYSSSNDAGFVILWCNLKYAYLTIKDCIIKNISNVGISSDFLQSYGV